MRESKGNGNIRTKKKRGCRWIWRKEGDDTIRGCLCTRHTHNKLHIHPDRTKEGRMIDPARALHKIKKERERAEPPQKERKETP